MARNRSLVGKYHHDASVDHNEKHGNIFNSLTQKYFDKLYNIIYYEILIKASR